MAEPESAPPTVRVRRRASREAGPVGDPAVLSEPLEETRPATKAVRAKAIHPAGPPPRRAANSGLVALLAMTAALLGVLVLGGLTAVLVVQRWHVNAAEARDQRFVDTASQTVVNMFSYQPDTIDQSVQRFVDGTSGPLHDLMSQQGSVDAVKSLFHDTNASAETAINGAVLEQVDEENHNASVLVSARVTVTDIDGVNRPSQPYRLRVIVHEDGNGTMTAYDLKYPNGGN